MVLRRVAGHPFAGRHRRGVVALYLVIAFETSFVIIGFLPIVLSLRSHRQREPLAPFAIAAAALAIVVAAVRIFGH